MLVQGEGKPILVRTSEALSSAYDQSLDLVEIAVNNGLPVCKVMDYGAHLYHESKKQQENAKRNREQEVKEMRFRPVTDDADFETKVRQMSSFLEKGHKVKVAIRFKGREIAHAEAGFQMMGKIVETLTEHAKADVQNKIDGRQIVALFSPLQKKK